MESRHITPLSLGIIVGSLIVHMFLLEAILEVLRQILEKIK